MTETDEILQRIQERLDARGGAANNRPQSEPLAAAGAPAPGTSRNPAVKLSPDQITSPVFVIAPSQISYIAEIFANSVADAMNMRAFAQKIRVLAEQSLRTALMAAKKQGTS